jgi:hypothetical protein
MTMSQKYFEKTGKVLVRGAINRRDIWPSREEAFKLLQSRPAWKVWDERVLKIYVVGLYLNSRLKGVLYRVSLAQSCFLFIGGRTKAATHY